MASTALRQQNFAAAVQQAGGNRQDGFLRWLFSAHAGSSYSSLQRLPTALKQLGFAPQVVTWGALLLTHGSKNQEAFGCTLLIATAAVLGLSTYHTVIEYFSRRGIDVLGHKRGHKAAHKHSHSHGHYSHINHELSHAHNAHAAPHQDASHSHTVSHEAHKEHSHSTSHAEHHVHNANHKHPIHAHGHNAHSAKHTPHKVHEHAHPPHAHPPHQHEKHSHDETNHGHGFLHKKSHHSPNEHHMQELAHHIATHGEGHQAAAHAA